MAILGDIQWERIHLVQMVELRYYFRMVGHMGVKMLSLRDIHW